LRRLRGEAAFRRLKDLAAAKGGECLSRFYRNQLTKMRFRCAREHVWFALPVRITEGSWCPKCRLAERLVRMHAVARANGGECFGRRWRGSRAKYPMRCAEGHVWKTKAEYVIAGHWCPICRRTGRPAAHDIADARRAAQARGGRLLSARYRDTRQKLRFECAAGHRFRTTLSKVINDGHWCRQCTHERNRLGIKAAVEVATRRGGRCLSTQYLNHRQPLEWECARGHRWRAALANVRKEKGTWCPLCNRPRRLTLEDMQRVARARGGKCLSKKFKNTTSHLWWECADGHQWRATPKNVRQHGTWCPDCARGLGAEEIEARRKALRGVSDAARRLLAAAGRKRAGERPRAGG
jgi:hypothetical protein